MEVITVLDEGESYKYIEQHSDLGYISVTITAENDGFAIYKAFADIPNGSYTPRELGLSLPGCLKINVGICPHHLVVEKVDKFTFWDWILGREPKIQTKLSTVDWSTSVVNGNITGHVTSYMGIDDNQMCIKNGKYVFSEEDTPTDVVMHEYAHILAGTADGHGPVWRTKMRELGQIPSLHCGYLIV